MLHALPFDGSMWSEFMDLIPDATYAPTMYGEGNKIEDWAIAGLNSVPQKKIIIVGCSVGASCALEIAAQAPNRIAALVLIGCKADHRPNPKLKMEALELLRSEKMSTSWNKYWAPLFSKETSIQVVENARHSYSNMSPQDVARGVAVFHTRPSRGHVIANCQVPVIVITGTDDIAPGINVSRALEESAEQGILKIISDCGHYVPLEQPEALKAILRSVITETYTRLFSGSSSTEAR